MLLIVLCRQAVAGTWVNAAMGLDTFDIGANGIIGGAANDVWTVDEIKLFMNTTDGTY
jgi:hypothetical protein